MTAKIFEKLSKLEKEFIEGLEEISLKNEELINKSRLPRSWKKLLITINKLTCMEIIDGFTNKETQLTDKVKAISEKSNKLLSESFIWNVILFEDIRTKIFNNYMRLRKKLALLELELMEEK